MSFSTSGVVPAPSAVCGGALVAGVCGGDGVGAAASAISVHCSPRRSITPLVFRDCKSA